MIEKPKVLKCTLKVLENRSTFEMYLSTSTSTGDFPEMYLSTFQVLYKLYLSTDVLKYKVLLPGSVYNMEYKLGVMLVLSVRLSFCKNVQSALSIR